MQIRDYSLPEPWYSRDPDEVKKLITGFISGACKTKPARAAVSPHAGWHYSGRISAIGVSSLDSGCETIAVLGGHLPASSPALFAMEDAVRTPFGPMPIDKELREVLLKELDGRDDRFRDNTVEVLLPMVRYFFPDSGVLWLRLPAGLHSFKAGKIISEAASRLNRKINVLASTDLTHYGLNYGFLPQGTGKKALKWVREVNDANFIKAVEAQDSVETLRRAENDFSACSAGAVLCAMGFAEAEKLPNARLLEYGTSADAAEDENPDFFVGYAAMAFV